nr:hypothetical protein [uncultured Noviherbaspirillum sp.]
MKIRALRSIIASIAIAVLAGCAAPVSIKTYDGQQLPLEAISVLMVDRQIFVSDVAGFKTGMKIGTEAESDAGRQFEIKPGLQKIRFQFFSLNSSSDNVGVPPAGTVVTTTHTSMLIMKPVEISHDFEKGHQYELHYRRDGKKLSFRIVDVTNGGAKRDYGVAWGHIRS